MKKLLLLFFVPIVCFGQTYEIGNFKTENGLIVWQKIYDEGLNIKSQDLKLQAIGLPTMTTTMWLQDISGAELLVEKKGNRTRLTVKKIYSVSSVSLDLGGIQENVTPTYIEDVYLKKKDGTFRKGFIKKDAKLIDDIIVREINSLVPSNDDW